MLRNLNKRILGGRNNNYKDIKIEISLVYVWSRKKVVWLEDGMKREKCGR